MSENIVYKGTISEPDKLHTYIGVVRVFKERFGVHKLGFRKREYASSCEFTKKVWDLKDRGQDFSIKWKILERMKGRRVGRECKLCITEKLHIIDHPNQVALLKS